MRVQFTVFAMIVSLAILYGCASTSAPPIQTDVVAISGTTWAGTDSDGEYYEYQFMGDGSLHYKLPTGVSSKKGTWKQHGKTIYMETNKKHAEFKGTIQGQTMEGNALNIYGRRWTWSAKKR